MKSTLKSALVAFPIGLAFTAAGAQAAFETAQHQHEHSTPAPQKPTPDAMKGMEGTNDMHAMMADPAMRAKMMANMAQCRDMMSMMMEHMKHERMPGAKMPAPPKH